MKIKKDEVVWLLIFITPTIILFTLFFILPLLFLFATSFTNWDGINASFMGKIETAYANNIKVSDNIIFVATEDGIEIIQIDFTQ